MRTPSARDAATNMPGPMRKYGDDSSRPARQDDVRLRGARLGRTQPRAARTRSSWCETCLQLAGARSFRGWRAQLSASGAQRAWLADGALAHGRRRTASAARQSVGSGLPMRSTPREPDLGQRVECHAPPPGRCAGTSDEIMPPAIPIATYRLQLTAIRFRRRGGGRPLSEGARDHASLCLALLEGAQGIDPRLRHRRSHQVQSGTRRRSRI